MTTTRLCTAGDVEIGSGKPLAIIGGPCMLESLELGMTVGTALRDACTSLGLSYVFKASFDKANRSSITSPRGPGPELGLAWMAQIRQKLGVSVTTDVHAPDQAEAAAKVVDLLQIPAFLCRQTDLLLAAGAAAAKHRRGVNVKKGQFVAPAEMAGPVKKLTQAGCSNIMLTERGTFFGYHRLVNDFIGVGDLMELEIPGGAPPVCFDCTHSTQLPGRGEQSGGRPERAGMLARAAVAAGVQAIFIECHPDPSRALSDAATVQALDRVLALLPTLAALRGALEKQK